MEDPSTCATILHPPLHELKHQRRTPINRTFAAIYTCAILALFYHHTLTLLHSTTFVSFSFSLLLLIADAVFAFMWTTTQAFHMRPVQRREFVERLEKVMSNESDFPALDVFICTADPFKETPMSVVNTALSVMAYDYLTEKVSVYVSDDGGSELTLFAFMEAAKFASHWLPFCREKKIVERCPEAFFRSTHSWCSETQKIKMMYESMKVKVENVVERGKVSNEYITCEPEREAFNKWTDKFTRQDHPTVIQVLLESNKDRDIAGHLMPNLIYVSRQKSRTVPHHFKAGALNVLLRVSATMTNAPIVLTLDCDMYSNDPQTLRRVLCYLSDPVIQPKLGFIQFPQHFHGINKNDIYACEFKRLFQIHPAGLDGLIGPNNLGTGCFFTRRVFFGGPSSLVPPEIPELSPDYVVDKPIKSQTILAMAHHVACCNYEDQTNWGSKVSDPWLLLYVFLFLGSYVQDFSEFIIAGGTARRWWSDQRMWLIRGLSSYLFGLVEYFLKSLGMSMHGFNVTSKVIDYEQSKRYEQGLFEFAVPSPMFVPITMAAIINLVSFIWGCVFIFNGGSLEGLFLLMFISGFVVLNCWPIYEAIILRTDKGKMPTKTTVISISLAWALYQAASLVLKI